MAEGGSAPPAWARGMVSALARGDHRYLLRTADLALDAARADPPLLARVHTWLAQAWSKEGDLEQARDHLRLAVRAAKEAGDRQGLEEIRALRRQVLERARGEPPPPSPPTGALSAALPAPSPLADDAAQRALAALGAGEHEAALAHALAAREAARRGADPKAEVVALLAMARVPGHADAALLAARDVADLSGDMNLVAAVAGSARELGVDLGARVF